MPLHRENFSRTKLIIKYIKTKEKNHSGSGVMFEQTLSGCWTDISNSVYDLLNYSKYVPFQTIQK